MQKLPRGQEKPIACGYQDAVQSDSLASAFQVYFGFALFSIIEEVCHSFLDLVSQI